MQRPWRNALNADQKRRLREWEKKLENRMEKVTEARAEIDKLYRISQTNIRREKAKTPPPSKQ